MALTGTYYTPLQLVHRVLESALVPVMEERLRSAKTVEAQEAALLALRVCDPACGSGHFLLAAAERISLEVARRRHAGGTGSGPQPARSDAEAALPPELYRSALRDVVHTCIYGVDLDPTAVVTCREALSGKEARADAGHPGPERGALWAEMPPLWAPALCAHVKCGNSLIGVDRIAARQPDRATCDAWAAAHCPQQYPFFHWPLEFPEVFAAGGFDVVLANPPWEQLQPEEVTFFASHGRPDIAALPGARRKAAIREALPLDSSLAAAWQEHKQTIRAQSRFIRTSGRFPLTTGGRVNTYAVFMETVRAILHPAGRAGCIVPSGLVTDDTTKRFFRHLIDSRTLISLYHFDNREKLFPNVGSNITFCLLTLSGSALPGADGAEFAFFLHGVDDLRDPTLRFVLTERDLALLNPNTGTCPILRSRRDAELAKAIYRRVPVFVREAPPRENSWRIHFRQGLFNMTSVSHLFRTRQELETSGWRLEEATFRRGGERYVALYEAKMLHHFDHRWASCDRSTGHGPRANIRVDDADNHSTPVLPRYWVAEEKVEDRLRGRWGHSWLLGWRLVCRSTDERTVIGTVLPRVGCGNSILLLCPETGSAPELAALVACLNSFALDFAARQKLGGINLNFHILKQLPVLPPSAYASAAPWSHDERLADWIARRVLELVYTAPDLQPFAADLGYYGPPFPWDGERRFHLRCQLDAAFFWLYGMNREDAAYVLDTFPGVRRKDEKRFGEYRTKRAILEQLSLYRYFVDKGRGKR